MTVVVGASAHGSPGVTASLELLAAVWPELGMTPIVVEFDPAGGSFTGRYDLDPSPGFGDLAAALRFGEEPALSELTQLLPSLVACVPMPPSALLARRQVISANARLGSYLAGSGHVTLVDAGRIDASTRTAATIDEADILCWFVRPDHEKVLALRHRLAEMPIGARAAVVCVGDGPYRPSEVEEATGLSVLGTLPVDERTLRRVGQGLRTRAVQRSRLYKQAVRLAHRLCDDSWFGPLGGARESVGDVWDSGDFVSDTEPTWFESPGCATTRNTQRCSGPVSGPGVSPIEVDGSWA